MIDRPPPAGERSWAQPPSREVMGSRETVYPLDKPAGLSWSCWGQESGGTQDAWINHPWEETGIRGGLVSTPEMHKTAQEFNTHLENDFVCAIISKFEVFFFFFMY